MATSTNNKKNINKKETKKDSKTKKRSENGPSDDDYDTEDTSNYETVSEEEASSNSEIDDSEEEDSEDEEDSEEYSEEDSEEDSEEESEEESPKRKTRSSKKKDDDSDLEKAFVKLLKNKIIEEEKEEKKIAKNKNKKENNKKNKSPKKASKNKKSSKKNNKKHKKKTNDDDDDDESEDDSDYDEEEDDEDFEDELAISGPGIILSFDGFGNMRSDDQDYEQMKKEDKHEKCDSDDEQTFMKETYKKTESEPTPPDSPNSQKSKKKSQKNKKKKSKEKEETKDDEPSNVEEKYAEFVKLREELSSQLKKTPNNKILQNAIKECRKSISNLVKKERSKNTEKYYKLVHKEPQKKKNTNEISYFKKKLSHKEQLRVMKDLEEINSFTNTDKPYRLSLLESNIPPKFKAIALQKLNVLKSMQPNDSEYYKLKTWVDGFMRVPYGIYKNLTVTLDDGKDKCHEFIENAKHTLDSCTYGLDDAKMQILQMVGQWISNPGAMGTAIAIKGPPGTGKTTLVKEGISKILGREFSFIALGGTSDASFLEGHSYTYEGSTWGKIVSILQECRCMNPVIYFDELDKISETPKGEEIASILTHLTDSTQNNQFHDKYFCEVDFDLSKCLFIFSYNDETKVNPILKDRMYRIQTKGYEAKEKIIIARKHLLPKIREQVNFKEEDIVIPDNTLDYIIGHPDFCKAEQGVRNLKRCLEIIYTKLNLFRLVKSDVKIFDKSMDIDVKFPFTVEKKHVDILVKRDDPMNQSMLAMYI